MAKKLLKHNLKVVLCINKPWESLFEHEFRDLQVKFSVSREPLGTSGEVLNAGNLGFIDDTFLVGYSDDLTEINYSGLVEFHTHTRACGALASLALTHKLPLEVGICDVDKQGKNGYPRVIALHEKPVVDLGAWTGTAVYEPDILDFCEPNKDFAMHVIPEVLKKNRKVYAYFVDSIWFDIGSYGHYVRACKMLEGRRK
jgi:NDP-sugar pyrophosphorylase family protein